MKKINFKELLKKRWNVLIVPYSSGRSLSFSISAKLIFILSLFFLISTGVWVFVFFRNIQIIKMQRVVIATNRSIITGLVNGVIKKEYIKDIVVDKIRVNKMELVYDLDELNRQKDEEIAILSEKIKKLRREIISLQKTNRFLFSSNQEYLREINKLDEANKDMDENLGVLMGRISVLEDKLAKLTSLYENISNINRQNVMVITSLQKSNIKKDKELQILENKLVSLEKKIYSINKLAGKIYEINAIMHSGGWSEVPEHKLPTSTDEVSLYKRITFAINEASFIEARLKKLHALLEKKRNTWLTTPNVWPTFGTITSPYGPRRDPFTGRREMHWGIDIANKRGTPIYSTVQGIVSFAGRMNGLGKTIVIVTSTGYKIYFGHLSRILVRKGQRVYKGQLIGNMGSTGRSTGIHLHYEIHYKGRPVNPIKFLKYK